MNKHEYVIERFDFSQESSVRELHNLIYGWAPEKEEFLHKYKTESLGHSVIGFLAYDLKGNPVSYYGIFPVTMILDGRLVIAGQSGDTMTHPLHQGKGLFTLLARKTYEAAEAEGISFIFGFPNKNSYPGFIKKLGWSHKCTMRSYNFFVPTFPLSEIANRFKFSNAIYSKLKTIVLKLFNVSSVNNLKNSVLAEGVGGTLRNDAFLNYKYKNLFCLSVSGVDIYFKITKYIDIGDIILNKNGNLNSALRTLRCLAFFVGVFRIRYYVSPGSFLEKRLSGEFISKDGLPYGYLPLNKDINPDNFAFTYIDYDTF